MRIIFYKTSKCNEKYNNALSSSLLDYKIKYCCLLSMLNMFLDALTKKK